MKKIQELTEEEILKLTGEEIDKMIKVKMAEEGIKFIDYPTKPEYNEVQKPTIKVYYCHLFGQKVSFTDMAELTSVLEVLSDCKTMCSIDSNYDLPEGSRNYIKNKLENASYSNEAPETMSSLIAYTHKEYVDIKDKLNENSKSKKEFESKVKEYESAINDAKWIRDEIMERVNEVTSKYDKLNTYIYRFKNEYLPLADSNEDVAMKFLVKAYGLDQEQQSYVLSNYSKPKQ